MDGASDVLSALGLPAWTLTVISHLWSSVAVSMLVYAGGEVSKRVARSHGLLRDGTWYMDTLRIHPWVAGALLMQFPWPLPEFIDGIGKTDGWWPEMWARALWGAGCGACCAQVYDVGQMGYRAARRRLARFFGESELAPAVASIAPPAGAEKPPEGS